MIKKKLLLIDGTYLLFRSYYAALAAHKQLSTPHLFFLSIIKLIKNLKPSHLLVAFDLKGKTWRHQLYPDYKAHRKPTPEELFIDMQNIKALLDAFQICQFGMKGHEADDIIASAAHQYQKHFENIFIFSKDQDLLQLVNEDTSILMDTNFDKYITIDNFYASQGFQPLQLTDYKALAGDSSDNLPGVSGIGKVGAKKLLNQFQSLEAIYENLESDKISPSLKKKLQKDKDNAFFSKRLAALNLKLELPLKIQDWVLKIEKNEKTMALCKNLKLKYVAQEMERLHDRNHR